MNNSNGFRITPRLVIGGTILVVGLLLMAQSFGLFPELDLWDFWPLILVAIGLRSLLHPSKPSSRTWGVILLVLGGLFLARNLHLHVIEFRYVWPALLVFLGGSLIWRSIRRPDEEDRPFVPVPGSANRLNEWSAFGGGKRQFSGEDFQGGEVTVVFGGTDIDLRGAGMVRDEAVVDVFAMFGGVELKVPESWNVHASGLPIFGGFDDKSRHPQPDPEHPPKRLLVRGTVIFGGVEVRN